MLTKEEVKAMEKQVWVDKAMIYAKTAVEIVYEGRFGGDGEKRKWEKVTEDTWVLDGTPPKGTVILDDNLPSVITTNTGGRIILELKYPDNPETKYKEWYHNYFKREDLDAEVFKMIHSSSNTEEIVSMVISTIFSDIENNPERKISELREEWL